MFVSWLFPFVRFLRAWYVCFVRGTELGSSVFVWAGASSCLQALAMKQDDASFLSIVQGSPSFLMLYLGMDPLELIIFLAEFSPQALVEIIASGTSF